MTVIVKQSVWIPTEHYPTFREDPTTNADYLVCFADSYADSTSWHSPSYTLVGRLAVAIEPNFLDCDKQAISAIDEALAALDEKYAAQRHKLWQQKQELLSLTYSPKE